MVRIDRIERIAHGERATRKGIQHGQALARRADRVGVKITDRRQVGHRVGRGLPRVIGRRNGIPDCGAQRKGRNLTSVHAVARCAILMRSVVKHRHGDLPGTRVIHQVDRSHGGLIARVGCDPHWRAACRRGWILRRAEDVWRGCRSRNGIEDQPAENKRYQCTQIERRNPRRFIALFCFGALSSNHRVGVIIQHTTLRTR